jgi:hypothetical protein
MPFLRLATPLLAAVLLAGCASTTVGCRSGGGTCAAYGPVNGEIENGTSCAFVVQNRHVCTYDAEGRFKGEDIRTGSGACICLGFTSQVEGTCAQSRLASLSR